MGEPAGLRARCVRVANTLARDAMLRQNSPVDTILEFVIAERGRAAEPALDGTSPLCLYFPNDADRDEFIALVQEAKPGMRMRKVP